MLAPRLSVSLSQADSRQSSELSELEFGLILAGRAYNRWVVRCMAAAGIKNLTAVDVLLLEHVDHGKREKKLGDISFMLNIEDTHVVSYSLRKLISLGVVKSERRGKEVVFFATPKGLEHLERFREIRDLCLVASLRRPGTRDPELGRLAHLLRGLSGLYDQAARAATSL